MRRCLSPLALLGLLLAAHAAWSQSPNCAYANAELVPTPLVSGTPLSVRSFGSWPTSGSGALVSSQVNGTEIRVALEGPGAGPASVNPFWEDFMLIGPLAPGTYDLYVDVTMIGISFSFTCGPTQQVVASAIPAASTVATLALAAALALLGWFKLCR